MPRQTQVLQLCGILVRDLLIMNQEWEQPWETPHHAKIHSLHNQDPSQTVTCAVIKKTFKGKEPGSENPPSWGFVLTGVCLVTAFWKFLVLYLIPLKKNGSRFRGKLSKQRRKGLVVFACTLHFTPFQF